MNNFAELALEKGATEVKDRSILSTVGTTQSFSFFEGDEIKFPISEEARFSSIDFKGHPVYRVSCTVNEKAKWVPVGSFRKKSFLNYQEWIRQPELAFNKELCEAGNDLALVEMLFGKTIKCMSRIEGQVAAEFVEDPITHQRTVKKDADGNPMVKIAKFPVWQLSK